jgi:hypothetical protein
MPSVYGAVTGATREFGGSEGPTERSKNRSGGHHEWVPAKTSHADFVSSHSATRPTHRKFIGQYSVASHVPRLRPILDNVEFNGFDTMAADSQKAGVTVSKL